MKKFTTFLGIIALTTTLGFAQKPPKKTKKQEVVKITLDEHLCPMCKRKIDKQVAFEKGITDIVYNEDGTSVNITYRADKTDTLKLRKAFEKVKLNVESLRLVDEKK